MNVDLAGLVDQLRSTLGTMEVALGAIADALVWTGKDGTIQWCNAAFDKLVERPHILVLGMKLSDLLNLTQAAQPVPLAAYPAERTLCGEYAVTEYEFQQGDRSLILEISGNCVELSNGNASGAGHRERSSVLLIRDVTQARQAQAEYQQAEQQRQQFFALMRATLESMDDAVLVLTTDRQTPVYNQKFLAMWSMPEALMQPGREDDRLQWLLEQTKDPEAFLARIWELLRDRPAETALDLIEMQDGRIIERLAQPLWNGEQILGRVWTYRDVTQNVQTEQGLREREAKFRSLVENANDLIFAIDAAGIVSYISPNVQNMMGFTTMEMEGGSFMPFVYPDDLPQCLDAIKQVTISGQGVSSLEYRAKHKDGSWHWYVASLAAPQAVNDQRLIVGIARDISEAKRNESVRKQAEEALRRSELKYRNIFENSQVGIGRTRLEDGLFLDVNQRYAEIMGFNSAADLIGKRFSTEFYANPDDQQKILAELERQGEVRNFEEELRRPDGSTAWGLLSLRFNADEHCLDFVIVDISDRKRLEEELRQSQQFLDNIIDNIPLAVFAKDVNHDFRYVLINKGSADILGFTKEIALGLNDYELTTQAQADFYRAEDLATLAQGKMVECAEQWKQVRIDSDKTIALRYWKLPLFDLQGNATHLLCMSEDITERKQAEAAIERRACMDNLLSSISRQFVDQDADTAINFTLQAIAQFMGVERCCIFEYAEPQRQLHTIYEWCTADVKPLADSARNLSLEQFPWYHTRITKGDTIQITQVAELPAAAAAEKAMFQSQQIQSVLDVPMVYAGKLVGVFGTDVVSFTKSWTQEEVKLLQLVSELIAMGRSRQQAEEKFTKAFRASPSPIALTTLPERRFLDVNTSFLKMSGCVLEEIIGYTASELDVGVTQETYSTAIQQLLETGSLYNQEVEFRTKSGEVRIVLLSIELIDLSGTQCVLNIINDITERKQLENEFISLVSHELRTPLTSLMGGLYLLGSGQLGTLTPKGQNVLNIATTNTERLTRLVNDILDLERMKAGQMSVQPVTCNAADLLTQAAEAMQAMADQAQITLVTEPLTATLFVDPDRILQTLTNLLSNAIKFSPSGSTVWLRAQLHIDHIQIQVQDQGRGIPADKLQLVFDRFQQVDQSDARQKGGTGLGLAICRSITEQHGGKIWVESIFGQGSTFFLTLPLLQTGISKRP